MLHSTFLGFCEESLIQTQSKQTETIRTQSDQKSLALGNQCTQPAAAVPGSGGDPLAELGILGVGREKIRLSAYICVICGQHPHSRTSLSELFDPDAHVVQP